MKVIQALLLASLVYACTPSQPDEQSNPIENIPVWTLEETITIQETDDFIMGFVGSPLVTSKGEILLPEFRASKIFHFDAQGAYLGTFSQKGSGPGEINDYSTAIITKDDKYVVFDRSEMRFTIFDKDNDTWKHTEMINTETNPGQFFEGPDNTIIGRTQVSWNRRNLNEPDRGYYLRQMTYSGTILKDSLIFGPVDNFLVWETEQAFSVTSIPGGHGLTSFSEIYDENTIIHAQTDRFEFTILDIENGETRTISHDLPLVPLTPAEKDTMLAQVRSQFVNALQDKMPEYKRAINSFFVDDVGNIWVNITPIPDAETAYNWLIMDFDGKFLGKLQSPKNFTLSTSKNGLVYGMRRSNETGITVSGFKIIK